MNENGDCIGLSIVVFHPSNGKVLVAQVFLIGSNLDLFDTFIERDLPDGSIVAAACNNECIMNLSERAKQWFLSIGS